MDVKFEAVITSVLQEQKPNLFKIMAPINEHFMAAFQKEEDPNTRIAIQDIMSEHVPQKRLDMLIKHIEYDPIPRYQSFKNALIETGQKRVIQRALKDPFVD